MKYHTKLLASFVVTTVLSNGLTFTVAYHVASRSLFEEIGNNALSIAATTATFVDGDEHKAIQVPEDESKEAYSQIREILKRARVANQRHDTWVENLYTMKPKVGAPNTLAYGVDTEVSPEKRSSVDQTLIIQKGRIPVLGQQGVDRDGYSGDEQGSWLSANVPVRDRSGNLVAAVGVDIRDSFVQAKLDHLKYASLAGFGIAVALGFGFALWYSVWACKPLRSLCQTVEAIQQGNFDVPGEIGRADEFGQIGRGVKSMADGLRQMEAVKSAFGCYVSSRVLEKVLETGMLPTVYADRRRITVLFSDIREFMRMSENMRPEEVVKILNEYFEKMVEVVVRNYGMVDKFIGDGLMAFFGAPDDDDFQEEHAVTAALEMQQELHNLCKKWSTEGRRSLEIGIGISSGNAIVGNIGSAQRLEYTAIGDTVNLAARLESATKDLNANVLISEYTYQGLKGSPFSITKRGATSVRGRDDSVTVYSVAPNSDAATDTQPEVDS